MNKIIVIAKVRYHITEMQKVLQEMNLDIPLLYEPDSEQCFETASREIKNGAKIIVCSDFLKLYYFESFKVKIIPIVRNPFRFAKQIRHIVLKDPKTRILCRSDSTSFTSSILDACELLNLKDIIHFANNTNELESVLSELNEQYGNGFTIIGSVWMHHMIQQYGFFPERLPFAQEDFRTAINQAVCELALMEEQEKFSEIFLTVLNFVTVGIICLDETGIITRANQTVFDNFNLSPDIIGKSCQDVGLGDLYNLGYSSRMTKATDEIINIEKIPAKVNIIPQVVNNKVVAYVTTISPVQEILADERRIRRQLLNGNNIAKKTVSNIVGTSTAITKCKKLAQRYAKVNSSILISGPSGSGKEVFAQSIHNLSDRNSQPFVAINCGALPESLLESVLFGYDKGTFTGALREGKRGLFETAHKGTIFLDEISEMPLSMQARFLRVIQEREVLRLGSTKPIPIDIRIISATNRDLRSMVEEKTFRADLYYRLSVLILKLPPLSSRPEDITLLAKDFIRTRASELRMPNIHISPDALAYLTHLKLDGNVRELHNILERCLVMADNQEITLELVSDLMDDHCAAIKPAPDSASGNQDLENHLQSTEATLIREILKQNKGSRKKTAAKLGISTSTLWRKMKSLNIE